MSSLDEELDREVQQILSRGEEGRRSAAIRDLTASSPGSIAGRVTVVAAVVAAAAGLMHMAGLTFAFRAVRGLCVAVGLCG